MMTQTRIDSNREPELKARLPAGREGPLTPRDRQLNVLILLDRYSLFTNTVRDHLDAFARYSCHQVVYAHATDAAPLAFSLDSFDVVLVHYSVRLAYEWHISPAFAQALRSFNGLKVLFIQDEYDNTWQACRWIDWLKIGVVFTCVPLEHVRSIYSRVDHQQVTFLPTLTGYLPLTLENATPVPPLHQRRIVIGYRGRELPFRYGLLAREKMLIGKRMRASCLIRSIPYDIEWSDKHRLYGRQWHDFLTSCRSVLGSESGSNVFDFDGSLSQTIAEALKKSPGASFEEIHEQFLRDCEFDGLMNQISPRIFEAIAARTGLVLFEGKYSGVVRPEEHFIPLKKDFSNVEEVLAKVQHDSYLEPMIERAYQHVVGSGLYTYRRFIASVDRVLSERVPARPGTVPISLAACLETKGCQTTIDAWQEPPRRSLIARLAQVPFKLRLFQFVKLRLYQLRAANELLRKEQALKEVWDEIRRESVSRAAFGRLLPSYKEFINLALLRCSCLRSFLNLMPWTIAADFDTQTGCLRFSSRSFYRLDSDFDPEPIRAAGAAVRAGALKQVIWSHGPQGDLYLLPFGSGKTVHFYLSAIGTIRFAGLERLAGVNPELVIRLLHLVSGMEV